MLDVGAEAPEFSLTDHEGGTVRRSDFAGRPLVVYFYPRADTSGCTTEAKGFRDRWDAFQERDAVVLGISDDPVEDNAAFAEKYDIPFPLLSDPDGSVASAYDSYGEKNMYGRSFDGVFRNSYLIGPEGRIAAAYEDVDPDGHAAEVLEDVDRLE